MCGFHYNQGFANGHMESRLSHYVGVGFHLNQRFAIKHKGPHLKLFVSVPFYSHQRMMKCLVWISTKVRASIKPRACQSTHGAKIKPLGRCWVSFRPKVCKWTLKAWFQPMHWCWVPFTRKDGQWTWSTLFWSLPMCGFHLEQGFANGHMAMRVNHYLVVGFHLN